MAEKARLAGVRLRPHFKTHQSAQIGQWFSAEGITSITVSSVEMAHYFSLHGWDDITIAFPLNVLEIGKIRLLAEKINLNLLIENTEAAQILQNEMNLRVGIYLKMDTGYHRTGLNPYKFETINRILDILNRNKSLVFKGFLSHTGHTYEANNTAEIRLRLNDALLKLDSLKQKYAVTYPGIEVSIGDTPSCSICSDFREADELRPGNFVFYDLMMYKLGVCQTDDIAVKMVCPVVSRHLDRGEIVIYGGAIHFSKDYIINKKGVKEFGRVLIVKDDGQVISNDENYLARISQEHGVLKIQPQYFEHFQVGKTVGIIPVHSCLTAHQSSFYLTTEGEKIATMNSPRANF